MSNFRLFQFTQVYIYAIALIGLNLLTGYNGQFSLGHGAFYAIGAYISAIMMDRWAIALRLDHPGGRGALPGGRLPVRPARAAPRGPLPGAGHLLARPRGAADPQVLRALDGRLAGHRAHQAQGAVGPQAHRGPVALLGDPRRHRDHVLARRQPRAQPRRPRHRGHPRQPHRRRGHGREQRALQVADLRGERGLHRAWRGRCPRWPSPTSRPTPSTCSCPSPSSSASSSAAWRRSGAMFWARSSSSSSPTGPRTSPRPPPGPSSASSSSGSCTSCPTASRGRSSSSGSGRPGREFQGKEVKRSLRRCSPHQA